MLTKVKKGINDYVVYDLNEIETDIDKVSMMMINSNQHEQIGLAPISLEKMNGICYRMLFDITGKVPLSDYIRNNISQKEFQQMLLSMINAIEEFDEYMIDIEKKQILLDPGYVYINPVDHSISFICIALQGIEQECDLYRFFREVIQNSDVALNQNEISYFNLAYRIIRGQDGGFSLPNLKTAMSRTYLSKTASKQYSDVYQAENKQEKEIENPGEKTVEPVPPRKEIPELPASEPEEEATKKKGFTGLGDALGNIFQFGKKKSSLGYQSGLSKLNKKKTKAEPTAAENKKPNETFSVSQTAEKHSLVSQQNESYQALHYDGTTVPKETTKISETPPTLIGTTVLNEKLPDDFPVSDELAKSQETPLFSSGTTALNRRNSDSFSASPGTTVLKTNPDVPSDEFIGTTALKTACLIRLRNHGRFFINKSVTLLGRDAENLDCNIHDNTNVSHQHAKILEKNGEYYIMDMGSFNYTYLNNRMLPKDTELKLSDGDKIRLADEEFEFRIV